MNASPSREPTTATAESDKLRLAHRVAAGFCALEAVALLGFAIYVVIAGRGGPVDYEAGVVVFVVALAGILGYLAQAFFRGDSRGRGAALTLQVLFVLMVRIPGEPWWVVGLARMPFLLAASALVTAIYLDNQDTTEQPS